MGTLPTYLNSVRKPLDLRREYHTMNSVNEKPIRKLRNPIPIRELLQNAWPETGLPKWTPAPKETLYTLQQEWEKLLPPPLNHQTYPLRVERKRLILSVNGSVWANEIQLYQQNLLKSIATLIPDSGLTEIRCKIR